MSNIINFLRERNKYLRSSKEEYFPLSLATINGESILMTFYESHLVSPLIKKIIKKVAQKQNESTLLISSSRYYYLKRIHYGYLSEKEQLILLLNSYIHIDDPEEVLTFRANLLENRGRRRRSDSQLKKYKDFIDFFHQANLFVEFYAEINLDEMMRVSKRFSFDPVLGKFCKLLNVLLDAIKKDLETIDEKLVNQILAS